MDKIIYSKCSNERDMRFSLRTVIYEDENGKRRVEKHPDTVAAKAHVNKIFEYYQALHEQYKNTNVQMNRCVKTDQGIELEYLEKPSLESLLDQLVFAGRKDEFLNIACKFFDQILSVHQNVEFVKTEEFVKIFGNVEIPEGERCGNVTNIDALFGNILLLDQDTWCMLDYEWTFTFPVPVKYLIYRVLFYYVHEHPARECVKHWISMENYGITEKDIVCYRQMEANFQNYIQGTRVPIRDMYDSISPGMIHLDDMKYYGKALLLKKKVQIYQADVVDVTEKDSYFEEYEEGNVYEKTFFLSENVKYFRLDPCSYSCLVKHLEILAEGQSCAYITNGIVMEGQNLFFDNEDPYIVLEHPEQYAGKELSIRFETEFLEKAAVCLLRNLVSEKEKNKYLEHEKMNLAEEVAKSHQTIQQLNDRMNQMENTKVWKMYSKYRSMVEK